MKTTKWIAAALVACMVALLAAGCKAEPEEAPGIEYDAGEWLITDTTVRKYRGKAEDVVIPAGVKNVGEHAFENCGIKSAVIPDGVTVIDDYAFYGCASLKTVTVPASVVIIGNSAFIGYDSFKEIRFNGTTAQWKAIYGSGGVAIRGLVWCSDGYVGIKDPPEYLEIYGTEVRGYTDGLPANLVIPEGVESIGDSAFCVCKSLESVTIPGSVTEIGDDAFYGCNNVTKVTYKGTLEQWCALDGVSDLMYAENVTVDGKDLKSMTELVIPDGVTSIGNYAFSECSSLESVTIPGSVESIGDSAFYGCNNVTKVTYQGTLEQWCALDGVYDLMYAENVTVDGKDLKSMTELVIPDGVTSIGNYAFSECSSLESVTIPDSVTSIGYEAFYGCETLKTVLYGGTKEEWNGIKGIDSIGLSTDTTIHGKDNATWTYKE